MQFSCDIVEGKMSFYCLKVITFGLPRANFSHRHFGFCDVTSMIERSLETKWRSSRGNLVCYYKGKVVENTVLL